MAILSRGVNREDTKMRIDGIFLSLPPITAVRLPPFDGPCFIIGGGPSLENFDFTRLEGRNSISVNKAFAFCNSTFNYAMDVEFYLKLVQGHLDRSENTDLAAKWKEYKGIKVFLSPMDAKQYARTDGICFIRRIADRTVSRSIFDGIYGGRNSGFGAVMLAIALRANPIYLLGFDMQVEAPVDENLKKANELYKTHWHGGYADNRDPHDFDARLKGFATEFADMLTDIENLGIQIINLNTPSKTSLGCFPIVDPCFVL